MNGDSAMEIPEMLDELKQKVLHDENLRQELLATREDPQPLTAFAENVRRRDIRSVRWS